MCFFFVILFLIETIEAVSVQKPNHFDNEANQKVGDTLAQDLPTENANS